MAMQPSASLPLLGALVSPWRASDPSRQWHEADQWFGKIQWTDETIVCIQYCLFGKVNVPDDWLLDGSGGGGVLPEPDRVESLVWVRSFGLMGDH